MELSDKTNAILQIRPNAIFTLRGDDIEWLDETQTQPTDKEIADGLIAFKAAQEAKVLAAQAEKNAILERLGITADEAKLLLS